MRFNRIIAGTITAGLVGFVPLAVSSPAEAAGATTTTLAASAPAVVYGDTVSFSGNVADAVGGAPYTGTVSLQVYSAANPVWTEVQSDTSPSSYYFSDVKPAMNSQYQVVYSGATETSGDVFAPSTSAPVTVGVQRKTVLKTKGLVVIGKVKPDFGKKKVVIKRKKGKRYVAFKKVKTNKKGAFRFKAPGKKGFKFSVTIPSDANYIGYTEAYYVY